METITIPLPAPSVNGNGNGNGHHTPVPSVNENGNGHHKQTGPKTLAGKSQSRLNAVKHGYEATDDVFVESLTNKERNAFNKIRRGLRKFYHPASVHEKLLVDRMAIQHLRMFRLYKLESVAFMFLPVNNKHSILPHLDRFSIYDVRIEKQLRILHNRVISLQNPTQKNRPNFLSPND